MKKVIIIGAGPAGLTAADKLLDYKQDYEVIILEESQEIGGISKTVEHNGNRMDIGGHRFFSKNKEVMEYWKDLMPLQGKNSFDDETGTDDVYLKVVTSTDGTAVRIVVVGGDMENILDYGGILSGSLSSLKR